MFIRSEQIAVLEKQQHRAFIERAAAHFATHFPDKTSREDWQRSVQQSIERARMMYRLTLERDLCLFLDLCGSLGWGFDTAPENAWMRAALLDPSITNPGDRIRRLVRVCLRRQTIANQNEALRQFFTQR